MFCVNRKYDNVPYVGLYKMFTPVVILRDPELIKNILSTDFNHFAENDFRTSKKYDPLLSENPFVCSGEKWKENRKSLLPAFSSGKMKILFNSMNCVANQMVNYINAFDQNTDFEAKDVCFFIYFVLFVTFVLISEMFLIGLAITSVYYTKCNAIWIQR